MSIQNIDDRLFALQTRNTSYIISLSKDGILENLYWGKRIERSEDFLGETSNEKTLNMQGPQLFREECSSFGAMCFKEASMKVRFPGNVRDFRYKFSGCRVRGETLELILEDIYYPFQVHLFYQVYPEADMIKKWRKAENRGKEPIVLERFYSGEYGLPGEGYESINYKGCWAGEFLEYSEPVDSGKKIYESLYGLTAHTVNPVFILHRHAEETKGEVYYGALEYSGNFKCVVEAVNSGWLNILLGISDTDFSWTLNQGESFETPAVYSGYSDAGFEKMSHTIHRFCREYLMPSYLADKSLPVLYNSWYSTAFSVECQEQIALARKAAAMGIELFVVDDGWFEGRKDDTAGLGDWFVDREKFPKGLQELSAEVHRLGMKFGVWIEPEMVNPESRLFREHPEWIYRYPTREVLMGRNQYELDMSNPQVVDYLLQVFDGFLTENKIEYVKWDMNRYGAERGSQAFEPDKWKELDFRNTQGIYRLIRELRKRHPQVEFEACAAGGGRVDYGAMRHFDEYWPSDNTDPLDRLCIQESYSRLYPVKYMRAWLTDDFGMDERRVPLKFRMHSAMCGVLGIGIDLKHTPEEEQREIAGYIREYKKIRDIVQFGKLYRLCSLKKGEVHVVQYVKEDRCVLFLFLDHERYGNSGYRISLRGLEEKKIYEFEIEGNRFRKTGAYIMYYGIDVRLSGDYDSRMIFLHTV